MHTRSDHRPGRRRLAGRATAAVAIMLATSCLSFTGAQAATPTRVNGEAIATYRAFDQGGVHVDGGYSRTQSGYNRDLDAMVSEATTRMSGLDLPGGMHIGNFESFVKLIVPRVGEPKV